MKARFTRPSPLTLLVAGVLLLVPVLAFLQYRWIGQLSDADRDRLQRTVRAATTQVAQDIDLEIARALIGLQLDAETVQEEDWAQYAERYAAWHGAAVPAVVRDVLLVDAERGRTLRVRRWDPLARTFAPAEWDESLAPLRDRLADEYHQSLTKDADSTRPHDLLADDLTAIVAPLVPGPPAGPGLPPAPAPFGYTIIRLDQSYIRERLLPTLVARHFGADDEEAVYRVAIVEKETPSEVIYRRGVDEVDALVAQPDATADCFGLRPDQFTVIRLAATSLRLPQQSGGGERRRSVFLSYFGRPRDGSRGGTVRSLDDLSHWRVVARHRKGSLETAITQARTRNLFISFGILIVMAGSVVLLAQSARRARRLARQQIEFVAGVSHELRTPVSVISAAAENLADGVVSDPARVKTYGSRIQTEARRLGETVERVLTFAGIEAGRGVGLRSPLSPSALIDEALSASAATLSGVEVETDVRPGLPPVLVDPVALRSSLQNLIGNAVKYGGTQRWIRITATAGTTRRGEEVRIAVEDRGLGIPPADLPHIFEPFYRGGEALARQIQGNGLGLSVVKRIIEAHGGRVGVQSTPGAGSTFTVTLPAHRGEPAPAPIGGEARAAARH